MGAGSVRARYLVYFQYLGTDFNGVAAVRGAQHAIGVQNYLEEAAERLNSVVPVKFTISSRTDAGVHALSNAAHLDVQRRSGLPPFSPEVLMEALNTHLRHPAIRVLQAFRVPSHFHARHAATSRTYLYRLVTGCRRPDQLPVFERNRCWALRAERLRFWSLEFESQSFLYRQVGCVLGPCQGWGLGLRWLQQSSSWVTGAENDICAGGRGAGGFDACSGEGDCGEPGPPGQAPEPCGPRPRLVPEGGALRGLRYEVVAWWWRGEAPACTLFTDGPLPRLSPCRGRGSQWQCCPSLWPRGKPEPSSPSPSLALWGGRLRGRSRRQQRVERGLNSGAKAGGSAVLLEALAWPLQRLSRPQGDLGSVHRSCLYVPSESTARRSQVTPDTQQGQGSRGTLGPAAGRSQLCTPPCITHGPRQAPRLLSAWTCHKSPPARVGCQWWGAGDKRKHRKARHPNSLWWFLLEINTPGAHPPISWEPRSRNKK
ncbi:tRNA pseudouridine synthase-like 1 isoform 3-T3 [Megaptera novaeangliae]